MATRARGLPAWLTAFGITWGLSTLEIEALKTTPLLPKQPDPLDEFTLFVLPMVALVCLAVYAVQHLARRPGGFAGPATVREAPPSPAALASKAAPLPETGSPGAPVVSIRAEDHYLRVRTPSQTLYLGGRMRDVLERLGQSDGLQVHRSWWVARGAVARVARQGRDDVLVLGDGTRVPVARNRLPQLRAAGWL